VAPGSPRRAFGCGNWPHRADRRYRAGRSGIPGGLRADMDALPLAERTGLPYASLNDGIAHACGHDLHVAAVLGAGLALQQQTDPWRPHRLGVRLIFQPAEEVTPGDR